MLTLTLSLPLSLTLTLTLPQAQHPHGVPDDRVRLWYLNPHHNPNANRAALVP